MLSIPKGYFHDKTVLLLVCGQFFVAALGTILILLRLSGSGSYIVQHRPNLGPLSQDEVGSAGVFFVFIIGFVLVAAVSLVLSMKMYTQHRTYSILMLSQGMLVLLLAAIVSDALLRAS